MPAWLQLRGGKSLFLELLLKWSRETNLPDSKLRMLEWIEDRWLMPLYKFADKSYVLRGSTYPGRLWMLGCALSSRLHSPNPWNAQILCRSRHHFDIKPPITGRNEAPKVDKQYTFNDLPAVGGHRYLLSTISYILISPLGRSFYNYTAWLLWWLLFGWTTSAKRVNDPKSWNLAWKKLRVCGGPIIWCQFTELEESVMIIESLSSLSYQVHQNEKRIFPLPLWRETNMVQFLMILYYLCQH